MTFSLRVTCNVWEGFDWSRTDNEKSRVQDKECTEQINYALNRKTSIGQ